MVALVELCSRFMYFPVIPKYPKQTVHTDLCASCHCLTFCWGSVFPLGREHMSLTGAAAAGPGKEWQAELVGGLTWVLLLTWKMLLWLSSKLNFCERWAVGSAWLLWGYATEKCDFFVCLWLFFLKAGSDLKRALFCFGKWLLDRQFL